MFILANGKVVHLGCLQHVPLMSVVWHLSLQLMNSFNKTEAAIFPMQAMIPFDFPFSQITVFVSLLTDCMYDINLQYPYLFVFWLIK